MYENSFYKSLVTNSLSPFLLFSKDGKLVDFNKIAEFLLNDVSPKEIYELALNNASHSFGFEQKFLDLHYGKDSYYAILVGYIDDEFLGIELYKQIDSVKRIVHNEDMEFTNIFSLLEISKATMLSSSDIFIKEIYDTSLPEIKVNINNFLLTLNEFLKSFTNTKNLTLQVHIKIGEYEIIENKKYSIISIDGTSDIPLTLTKSLEEQAYNSYINVYDSKYKISLEFPMILN